MSELTDIRRDPRTKVYNYVTVDPEVYTVAEFANLPGVFGVLLKFRPDPSNILIEYTYDDTPLTKVTSFSPGLGEVYIDYVQGYCIVNADDDGVEIRVTYKGGGGLNHKRNLELLATFSGKTTDDLTEGATNKYASAANAAGFVNAASDKTTPADADRIGFTDSAATYVLKRFTFANLWTWVLSKLTTTGAGTPIGTYIQHAGATAPTGFLACDGAAVNRTTYAALFAVVSTTYGVGDGSTTFNLPDARGLVMVGAGSHGTMTRADASAFNGGTVGASRNDQMQGHYHNFNGGDYNREVGGHVTGSEMAQVGTVYTNKVRAAISDGTNGTPRTGNETRPAEIAVLVCIKY